VWMSLLSLCFLLLSFGWKEPAPPTDQSQPWRKTDRIRVWCQLSY